LAGSLKTVLTPARPFWHGLSTVDPLTVQVEDGRLLRDTVITKVFKILNLPALLQGKVDLAKQGLPFKQFSATVEIQNGILESRDISLNSPVVKMSSAGIYDLPRDRLDLSLAISPLGAYSDLIRRLPLFRQLLAGDRSGLTTALFEVKGPRDNPDIHYLPIESLAKGLTGYPRLAIDALVNLITLPETLTTPNSQ
jgi:hypothetical protein